ncbi:tetratricopeptide repeat protein, partial [Tessaracoccus sp. SD287]|uniref:tetratricopeptide repeat protein n=1 Tax=Tessaracoccus sp. SD287 TaxID=2782008 RepID=UPI001A96822A
MLGTLSGRQTVLFKKRRGVLDVSKRGVEPSDPGKSPWWLAFALGGAVVGASAPMVAGAGGTVAMVGAFVGGLSGVALSAAPPLKEWFSARAADSRVAALAGVGDTIKGRALESLRVNLSDRDASEFAPRDLLPVVRDLLANQKPVLIEGPSMSGKTRLVVQVIVEGWESAPLWFPTDDEGIRRLVESGQDPSAGTVVFLDDVDRFLSNSSLTLTLLEKWLAAKCLVVATITATKHAQWRDEAAKKLPGWDVLNKFTPVHLAPKPSKGELAAMRSTAYVDLVPQARDLGLPAILGGAPLARQKFRAGAEDRSWGWALVRAAADWRRVGLGPATTEQLQALADAYPDSPVMARDWPVAWDWASKPFNHTVALLRAVDPERWEVLDVIADDATWPLHPAVVSAMAGAALTPAQSLALAMRLYAGAHYTSSSMVEFLLADALTANDPNVKGRAALLLGAILVDEDGDADKAEALLGEALDQNPTDPGVLAVLALCREKLKDYGQAEQLYQRALAANPTDADILGSYAIFLTDVRGDHDQAEQMYQ